MRILLTNIASVTSIGLLKTIKKSKLHDMFVVGTEAQPFGMNSGSLLVDKYVESPIVESNEYISFIIDLCSKEEIDILFPVIDAEVYQLSKISSSIATTVITAETNILGLFRDKLLASIELSLNTNILIPRIITYNRNLPDKIIIRNRDGIGSKGIKIFPNSEICPDIFFRKDGFLQEYIEGDEYTVDILANKFGDLCLAIPRKRLQIKNGVSTKTQITQHNDIINSCKLIYRNYKIPGLSNVQFIASKKNHYFIELNPRFAGMGIAGVMASYNYIDDYISHFYFGKELTSFDISMKQVKWDTIVCRYYEETVMLP